MITDEELSIVSTLSHKQLEQELLVAKLEEELKDAKKQLDFIRQVELPNALAEIGLSSVILTNGAKIEVKQKYYASIPAEFKQQAFDWLEQHNYDSIIKNVVKCEFGKGENDSAQEAMRELVSLGLRPQNEKSVHPMTLKSFVKDLFERGEEFPLDIFGAGTVAESKVVLPK